MEFIDQGSHWAGVVNQLRCGSVGSAALGLGVDSNQAALADRLADRYIEGCPDQDLHDLVNAACERAAKLLPTRRQAAIDIADIRKGPVWCYLAFFGIGGRCKYVKVGMSSHPEMRIYGMTTGNPLDLTAIYACRFASRRQAYAAEQTLIHTLASIGRRGEWVEIDECAFADIPSVAQGMGSLIRTPNGERAVFEPILYKPVTVAA